MNARRLAEGRIDCIELTRELVRRPSVTPQDHGCQQQIADLLQTLGFQIEHLRFGEVDNLWARRTGTSTPLFVFAGHTDVVPTGPRSQWSFPPFDAVIDDGVLYGRGTADMKGSIAAMLAAVAEFVGNHPDHQGSIGVLLTSDEEGPARDGTVRVIDVLQARGEAIDWCLVGEPSSEQRIGDTIKNGRRGSIGGELTIRGKQGHIAYPHLASNPVHAGLKALQELVDHEWDRGNSHFPPTGFQISNIHAGTGAVNIIPGELVVEFNLRFSTESTAEGIKRLVDEILHRHGLDYTLRWNLSGHPFLTEQGRLVDACVRAVEATTGTAPRLSTGGGTSDGRFIAPTGAEVVELGPLNRTIHQIDECVAVDDLDVLRRAYYQVICELLLDASA